VPQPPTATPTPAAPAATPAPAAPAMAAKPSMAAKPAMSADDKKAKSKECSTQADAKSLHGKARKKFREECKKGA
jgi:hypothetical protein